MVVEKTETPFRRWKLTMLGGQRRRASRGYQPVHKSLGISSPGGPPEDTFHGTIEDWQTGLLLLIQVLWLQDIYCLLSKNKISGLNYQSIYATLFMSHSDMI